MSKLSKFCVDGWDYYQYCYAVKWHKDKYGDPSTADDARKKYEAENASLPPKIEDFYELELTSALIKKMLGEILGQRNIDITLISDKEPKDGN